MGVVGQRHAPAPEAGWTSGQVLTGTENLTSTGIRSADRPVRSVSKEKRRKNTENKMNSSLKTHEKIYGFFLQLNFPTKMSYFISKNVVFLLTSCRNSL